MHSPALLSAVLLFTASSFSHALVKRVPADADAVDAVDAVDADDADAFDVVARADAPGTPEDCTRHYTAKNGDTCQGIADQSAKYGKPFDVHWFMSTNPSVGPDCKTLYAGKDYCVDGKERKAGNKPGSKPKPKHRKPDHSQPINNGGNVNPPQTHVPCTKWYTASQGEDCLAIARKNSISWDDLLQWNPYIVSINRDNVKVCGEIKPGNAYCVARPTAFRAIGFYHPHCSGAVHNDVSVPPGATHEDGICINTGCKVGSLLIPPKINGVECPENQVQISYFESQGCGDGNWFGYGYASQGDCHRLWQDGWAVQSLHLRCAPEKDDCATRGECRVDAEPLVKICTRPGILSLDH